MSRLSLRRATTRIVVVVAAMIFLLLPATVAAGRPDAVFFNARKDFRAAPKEANPSGPWSYRRTAPNGSTPLLENFSPNAEGCGPSGDGQQVWFGPEVLDLPAVGKNTTGADAFPCGAFIPKGALIAHPGGDHAVVIRWTSPLAGSMRVEAVMIDRDDFCGDGIHWSLRLLDRARLARGNLANGDAVTLQTEWLAIDPGARLELKLGPGGTNSCDSTQVNLKIRVQPD